MRKKLFAVILLTVCAFLIAACANNSNQQDLYDYQSLYAYQSDAPTKETLEAIGQSLQAKDILDLKSVRFAQEPDGIHEDSVIFEYALQLSPENPKYTVKHQAIMQDAILIFALFPNINSVDIEFTQADYSFGSPYTREAATEVFGQDIAAFGMNEQSFTEIFPPLLEGVNYHPDVMDTVDYRHAMGLDESGN